MILFYFLFYSISFAQHEMAECERQKERQQRGESANQTEITSIKWNGKSKAHTIEHYWNLVD